MKVLDLRTLADEWSDELSIIDEDAPPDDYVAERDRCAAFESLCAELGCDPTPESLRRFGDHVDPTLIPDYEFEDYARELAEDLGAVPTEHTWPTSYIDWQRAADALRADYTEVEFDGQSYLIRA